MVHTNLDIHKNKHQSDTVVTLFTPNGLNKLISVENTCNENACKCNTSDACPGIVSNQKASLN